eukprot:TRINITY_DN967_c0_g1_i12.p1 TRINITY_DN967_c0_g1~~TRINITY_DN967_c0_g1_i12.p1  ORF type:complete len:839 (-),score=131.90 TRINITY_DN967_c0_g1_i12:229-2586(-)
MEKWVMSGLAPDIENNPWLEQMYQPGDQSFNPAWWSGFWLESETQSNALNVALADANRYSVEAQDSFYNSQIYQFCGMDDFWVDSHLSLFSKFGMKRLEDNGASPLYLLGWDRCDQDAWLRSSAQNAALGVECKSPLEQKVFYEVDVPKLVASNVYGKLQIQLINGEKFAEQALTHCKGIVDALNQHPTVLSANQKLEADTACKCYAGGRSSCGGGGGRRGRKRSGRRGGKRGGKRRRRRSGFLLLQQQKATLPPFLLQDHKWGRHRRSGRRHLDHTSSKLWSEIQKLKRGLEREKKKIKKLERGEGFELRHHRHHSKMGDSDTTGLTQSSLGASFGGMAQSGAPGLDSLGDVIIEGIKWNESATDDEFHKSMATILQSSYKVCEAIYKGGMNSTEMLEKMQTAKFWVGDVMPVVIKILLVVVPNPLLGAGLAWLQGILMNCLVPKEESESDKLANKLRSEMQSMIKQSAIKLQMAKNTQHLLAIKEEMDWIPNLLQVEYKAQQTYLEAVKNAWNNLQESRDAWLSSVQTKMSWLLIVQHDMAISKQYILDSNCMKVADPYFVFGAETEANKKIAEACVEWENAGTVFTAVAYSNLHLQIFNDMGMSNQKAQHFLNGLRAHLKTQTILYEKVMARSAKNFVAKRDGEIGTEAKGKMQGNICICYLEDKGAAEVDMEKIFPTSVEMPENMTKCNNKKKWKELMPGFTGPEQCCKDRAKDNCPKAGKDKIKELAMKEANQAPIDVANVALAWCKAAGNCHSENSYKPPELKRLEAHRWNDDDFPALK